MCGRMCLESLDYQSVVDKLSYSAIFRCLFQSIRALCEMHREHNFGVGSRIQLPND